MPKSCFFFSVSNSHFLTYGMFILLFLVCVCVLSPICLKQDSRFSSLSHVTRPIQLIEVFKMISHKIVNSVELQRGIFLN